MEKFQSLADYLGLEPLGDQQLETRTEPTVERLLDVTDPKAFCAGILESREFRQYIVHGITLGDLPPAVMCRIIDHAWGKPPDRIEHTGKDGNPIETITEVRRVIVRENSIEEEEDRPRTVTH